MKYPTLKDSRLFMGVSLSNKIFTRKFARQFLAWTKKESIKNALIVLFDDCEMVNIKAFQAMDETAAKARAQLRTAELKKMFEKIIIPSNLELTTQSESAIKLTVLPLILNKLHKAYNKHEQFYHDVHEQIRINLALKSERLGKEAIETKLEILSGYIILELAWFYAFFVQNNNSQIEVYPGAELFTKRNLIQGKYFDETGIQALPFNPIYIDIGGLLS